MRCSNPKLFAVFATSLICLLAIPGFTASTSTDWQEDIKQKNIQQDEVTSGENGSFNADNKSLTEDPLELLSIDNIAIEINNQPSKQTLLERDFSSWPYYLLSYDRGTDPAADLLMSLAKIFGIIFIIGLTIMLIRFFKLRKLRSKSIHQ